MPIFQCINGPVTVRFGYESFTFANNQIINTDRPEIVNNPTFKAVTDAKLEKRAPKLHQIAPFPKSTVFMSNEEIIDELKRYGVVANPYDLTDKLAYQLNMLRDLDKKTYITVVDDDGNPMWYEEFIELERKIKREMREKYPINTPEVPIVKTQEKIKDTEYKLATQTEVKKKGGSIGAVEYNDDYDLANENDLEELIHAKMKEKFEAPVDKIKDDNFELFKPEQKLIKNEDIKIENFEYLVETRPFCINEVPEDIKEGMKKLNIKNISMDVLVLFLKTKNVYYSSSEVGVNGTERAWFYRKKVLEYIESSDVEDLVASFINTNEEFTEESLKNV
jgi:uncharacterized protein YrzB (UPF0473 family)